MDYTFDLDDPDLLLEYLAPPIRGVRDGLDHGVSLADTKMSDVPHDPHLWAHWVRFGACVFLSDHPSDEWGPTRRLLNSGIEISRGPVVFRVVKSQHGHPPHPGSSDMKKAFWSQQGRLPFVYQGVIFPEGANLILDWRVDAQRQIQLALSKPTGVWDYKGRPQLEWRRFLAMKPDEGLRFEGIDEDLAVEFDLTELADSGDR